MGTLLIDLDCIEHNIRLIKSLMSKDSLLAAVLKADAYGLGAKEILATVIKAGADSLVVESYEEAENLAPLLSEPSTIKKDISIIVLEPLRPENVSRVRPGLIEPTVDSVEIISLLDTRASELPPGRGQSVMVHLNMDTGLFRRGIDRDMLLTLAGRILNSRTVILKGLYTESTSFISLDDSMKKLLDASSALAGAGIPRHLVHLARSASFLLKPETHLSMVRIGLLIYGIMPPEIEHDRWGFKPAISLVSHIDKLWRVSAGTSLGYNHTVRLQRESLIASVRMGYANGLPRNCGEKIPVTIRGKRTAVKGEITMNHIHLDVTDIPGVSEGDEIRFFGPQSLRFEEFAASCGMLPAELMILFGKLNMRKYLTSSTDRRESC